MLQKLRRILSIPRYALVFLVVSLVLMSAYALLGNFFVLGTLEPNPLGLEPETVVLLVFLALGSGLLAASWLYAKSVSAKTCAPATAGATAGLFASACPYCPPVLAYFLGAQSLYFLSAYGTIIAVISVALVYYGLYRTLLSLKEDQKGKT